MTQSGHAAKLRAANGWLDLRCRPETQIRPPGELAVNFMEPINSLEKLGAYGGYSPSSLIFRLSRFPVY